jgi:hypothetical protein
MKKMAFVWLVCSASIAGSSPANSAAPTGIGAVLPFSGGAGLYGKPAKLGLDTV